MRKNKTKANIRKAIYRHRHYYLLLLPGFIVFLIFYYGPLYGVILAFKDYKLSLGIMKSPWAGFKWFEILFNGIDFKIILRNSLLISFYKIIWGFPAPIMLALLLNELRNIKFKKTVQTIIYLPHFMNWAILGGILILLLSPTTGLQNLIGMDKSPLMNPKQFRALLVISSVWKNAGWETIIYLAAITSIDPQLYEAAVIDGASRFQQVLHITMPSILNTVVILLILRTGKIMNAGFEQVYMLYNPIVYEVSDIFDTYVYRVGLANGRYSLATAAGLFKSIVGLCAITFTNWLAKRMGGKGLV